MARGKQKIESQKRAQEKAQPKKGSQLDARQAAFKLQCDICKTALTHVNQLKEHYENKHPGKEVQKVD